MQGNGKKVCYSRQPFEKYCCLIEYYFGFFFKIVPLLAKVC